MIILQFLPLVTVSDNKLQMGYTAWTGDCYINGTIGDSRDLVDFNYGTATEPVGAVYTDFGVTFTQEMYGSTDGSCDPATKNQLNNDVIVNGVTVLDGTTDSITGWIDDFGAPTVAPMKQDGSGTLTDTETYTNMTFEVSNSSIPTLLPNGTRMPMTYVIDDTGAVPVMYSVGSGVADASSMKSCLSCP